MSGKLIVVTGGAGFVGSHLCKRLAQEGNRVISLDNYFTGSDENHGPGVDWRKGHSKDIAKHVPETPDLIFHLGEYARVEKSFEDVALVWDLNMVGTFGVLEYWREKNLSGQECKLVYAGSSTKFSDGGMGRNLSPYTWTKAANTELVSNYGTWFNLPHAITYFYNVFGPGERAGDFGTVVEIFKQQYLKKQPLTVVTPGTQRRNFTHVDDIVDGLVLVGEKGQGDEFGLGNHKDFSVLEIAQLFGGEITMLPERPGNRMSSTVDKTKAEALGWKAERSVADYIANITKSSA